MFIGRVNIYLPTIVYLKHILTFNILDILYEYYCLFENLTGHDKNYGDKIIVIMMEFNYSCDGLRIFLQNNCIHKTRSKPLIHRIILNNNIIIPIRHHLRVGAIYSDQQNNNMSE